MDKRRLSHLNDNEPDPDGTYILYWMQQSQRASFNPALEYAVKCANDRDLGVIVSFGLMEDYPEANERHFAFMLEGLAEVADALKDRGIKFVVNKDRPDDTALQLSKKASLIVCDRGYLRHHREWRQRVADEAGKSVVQVEGDVVVPVETASEKAEYAARTIRPKLEKLWPDLLEDVRQVKPKKSSLPLKVKGDFDPSDPEAILKKLNIDRTVKRTKRFRGGTSEARNRLTAFLKSDFDGYDDARSNPADPQTSEMSPYLHFGQISPVEIVRKIRAAKTGSKNDRAAYLEELIVRRELAINFVYFNEDYDSFKCLPDWAQKTLKEHEDDERPDRYSRKQLEAAQTDDPYWNAAMQEMLKTGYMHNYMRMYWGKKILEWCNTPRYAYETALYLNNKYFVDGRDPSSYANIAWIFGLHDRPWKERPIFGKVRTMTASGLKKKFDVGAYIQRVEEMDV